MVQPNLQDFFLYSGKYTPEIYLNEEVRRGISSFAHLARKEEIENGLQRLRSDIETGIFHERTSKYDSRGGDYLFVVAEKSESCLTSHSRYGALAAPWSTPRNFEEAESGDNPAPTNRISAGPSEPKVGEGS